MSSLRPASNTASIGGGVERSPVEIRVAGHQLQTAGSLPNRVLDERHRVGVGRVHAREGHDEGRLLPGELQQARHVLPVAVIVRGAAGREQDHLPDAQLGRDLPVGVERSARAIVLVRADLRQVGEEVVALRGLYASGETGVQKRANARARTGPCAPEQGLREDDCQGEEHKQRGTYLVIVPHPRRTPALSLAETGSGPPRSQAGKQRVDAGAVGGERFTVVTFQPLGLPGLLVGQVVGQEEGEEERDRHRGHETAGHQTEARRDQQRSRVQRVSEPRVGAARRELAGLVQVSGRPDPQGLAGDDERQRQGDAAAGGLRHAQQEHGGRDRRERAPAPRGAREGVAHPGLRSRSLLAGVTRHAGEGCRRRVNTT